MVNEKNNYKKKSSKMSLKKVGSRFQHLRNSLKREVKEYHTAIDNLGNKLCFAGNQRCTNSKYDLKIAEDEVEGLEENCELIGLSLNTDPNAPSATCIINSNNGTEERMKDCSEASMSSSDYSYENVAPTPPTVENSIDRISKSVEELLVHVNKRELSFDPEVVSLVEEVNEAREEIIRMRGEMDLTRQTMKEVLQNATEFIDERQDLRRDLEQQIEELLSLQSCKIEDLKQTLVDMRGLHNEVQNRHNYAIKGLTDAINICKLKISGIKQFQEEQQKTILSLKKITESNHTMAVQIASVYKAFLVLLILLFIGYVLTFGVPGSWKPLVYFGFLLILLILFSLVKR